MKENPCGVMGTTTGADRRTYSFVSVVGYLKRFADDEGSTPSKGSRVW